MVRIESRRAGAVVVETYDLATSRYELTVDGAIDVSRPMTPAEVREITAFETARTVRENGVWLRDAARLFVEHNEQVAAVIDDPAGVVAAYLARPDTVAIDRPADAAAVNLASLNALKNWTTDRLNELEARRSQDRQAVRWLFDNIGNTVLRQTTGVIRYLFGWLDSRGGA